MGGLRTYAFGLGLVFLGLGLLAPASPLRAGALPQSDPVRLFATCTGRLSALMEFQWLMQDPGADATEARRDQTADLLGAVVQDGGQAKAMQWRLEAKVAEAALLSHARFGQRDQASWAMQLAQRQLADCTALLLS